MRDAIRRWLGFELDLRTRDEMIRVLRHDLEQTRVEARDGATTAAALEKINDSLCANLTVVVMQLSSMNLEIAKMREAAEKYVILCDPAASVVEDPIVCPNDHKGCMVVATIEEVDSKTLARKVTGHGIYCPKCQSSFYYHNGHRWSVSGTSVEVEQGVPHDTPKGVHREPEVKRRPLRFRG